jgi:cellobiose phosphorylase
MRIVVHNPQNVCKGVVKITVDGKPVKGNLVPSNLGGGEHQIEVWLGN